MGFTDFPSTQYFLVVPGTNVITPLGSIAITDSTPFELSHIQCTLQKVGAHAGTERIRLHMFPTDDYDTPIITSDWVPVTAIDSLESGNWAGYLLFDFNREPINPAISYFAAAEMDGYTQIEDVYYWAFALDWPEPVNTPAASTKRGAAMSILGYYNQ